MVKLARPAVCETVIIIMEIFLRTLCKYGILFFQVDYKKLKQCVFELF